MPIEASTALGLNGDRTLVDAGFSWKPVTSPLAATSTTPNRETSSGGMGSVASVTSAWVSRWCASMRL